MPQRDNESFEEKIKTLVGKYHRHKRRRKALLTFANGPERAVELMTTAQRTSSGGWERAVSTVRTAVDRSTTTTSGCTMRSILTSNR